MCQPPHISVKNCFGLYATFLYCMYKALLASDYYLQTLVSSIRFHNQYANFLIKLLLCLVLNAHICFHQYNYIMEKLSPSNDHILNKYSHFFSCIGWTLIQL